MAKKLTPAFSFSFDMPIWKTLVDASGYRLFLELRDATTRKASFAALDLRQHQLIWQQSFDEPWWIGLTAANDRVVILHTYTNRQNPEQKEFWAVDSTTHKLLKKTRTLADLAEAGFLTQPDELSKNKVCTMPFFYQATHAYFATVKRFIELHANVTPVKGCEYVEYQDVVGMAYYIEERKALANYLLVIDRKGREMLHKKIDEQLSDVGIGTFFIVRNQLIFIQQKRQLLCYAL